MNARTLLLLTASVAPLHGLEYFWSFGTNGNWNDPSRWGPLNHVPTGAGNSVELFVDTAGGHVGGPIHTITLDLDVSLDAFTHISDTCQLYAPGRTFTIDGPTLMNGHLLVFSGGSNYVTNGLFSHQAGHFDLLDSSLTGTGSYELTGGTALFDSATLSVPIAQTNGGLTLLGPTVFQNGFSSSGGTVAFDATGHLNVHNADWINGGTFTISDSGTNISINTSTGQSLINQPGGTITFNDTTAHRTFTLHLDNRGMLNLNQTNQSLSITTGNGTHSNSGTIAALGDLLIDNAESFDNSGLLNSTGGNLRFEGTSSATSTWSNSGTVTVNDGLWIYRFENINNTGLIEIDGGNATFTTAQYSNQQPFTNEGDIEVAPGQTVSFANNGSGTGRLNLLPGSTLTGGGNISISNQYLDIQTLWQPGSSATFLTNDTVVGTGAIETMDGIAATVTSTGIGVPFSNHGDLSWNGGNAHGGLTNETDGTLTVEEGATLGLGDQDVVNHGLLTFASSGNPSYIAEANANSLGRLVNSPTGTLVGEGPGTRYIRASFQNQGNATFHSTTSLPNGNGEHANSGTLTANANFAATSVESFTNSGTFNATAGTPTFQGNSSATSAFDNSGTLNLANGLTSSRFENIVNSGTMNIDGGTATFRTTQYSNQFRFTNEGDIVVDPGATFYCTIEGTGTGLVTLAPGSTLGGGGDVAFYSQSVEVQGAWSPGSSPLSLNSTTLTGAGSLNITDGVPFTLANTCNIHIPVNQHGDISVSNTIYTHGSFVNESDASFTIENGAQLRINDNDFINHGHFQFAEGTSTSYIFEADHGSLGSIVNSATGTFTISGTGNRNIQANLDNQGLLDIHTNTTLNNTAGEHANSGTLTSNANLTASNVESFTNSGTFHGTAGTQTFAGNNSPTSSFINSGTLRLDTGMSSYSFGSQTNSGLIDINGGSASIATAWYGTPQPFTNEGDIDVAPGASVGFYRSGSTGMGQMILMPGSTLAGGGQIGITNTTVEVQSDWSTGDSPLSLNTATLNGAGSLSIADGIPLTLLSTCHLSIPVTHHGDTSLANTTYTHGPFTNESDASFTIENGAQLRINDNDFINHGQLQFAEGTSTSYIFEADQGSLGSIVNSATGTFTINGTGNRNLQANLDNQGLLNIHTNTTLNNTAGEHANSGTLTSNANLTANNIESFTNSGTFHGAAGTQTFAGNNSPTSSFINSGTLRLDTGMSTYSFGTQSNSGLIDIDGGTASIATAWYGTPQPFTNEGDIDVAPGASVGFYRSGSTGIGQMILMPGSTLKGGGQIGITNTTVEVQDAWSTGDSPLSLTAATLNGAGSLSIADGIPLTLLSTCHLSIPVTHHGDASLGNTTYTHGPFTNESDASFTIENGAQLRINDNDFINHGQLQFAEGTSTSYIFEADQGSLGSIVNSATGTFTINGTGNRNLQANLDNQGLLDIHTNTTLNNTAGEHANSGTLTSNANLTASNIESFTNSGTFHGTAGTQTFTGNNSPTSSFINSGTLRLDTGMSTYSFGTQSNSGLIDIDGGTASIATAWYGTPQPFTNEGTIDVGPGAAVGFYRAGSTGIGTATNEATGRISGGGTVNIANTTFTNHGTLAPGNSTGVLTIAPMNHSASAVFEIEIADASGPGTGHDQLVVNGDLALNGTLSISRLGSFIPAPSDSFVVIAAAGELTGNFTAIQQSDPAGTWNVEIDEAADQVVLTFTEDTTIDFGEFQDDYFTPAEIANGDADPENDFDGDGLVNLLEWIHGFDPKSGGHAVAPIDIRIGPDGLDLIFPESGLLPESAYSFEVLSDTDPGGAFPAVPIADYTRMPDLPVPGFPNLHLVCIRIDDPAWIADGTRFFRLGFSATEP